MRSDFEQVAQCISELQMEMRLSREHSVPSAQCYDITSTMFRLVDQLAITVVAMITHLDTIGSKVEPEVYG